MVLIIIPKFIQILPGDIRCILAFLLVLLLSIIFSYITYNLIEVPGINIGKKVIQKVKFKKKFT